MDEAVVTGAAIGALALLLLLVLLFYWWRWRERRHRKAKLEQQLEQLQELLTKLQKPEVPEMVQLLNDALLRAAQQNIPISEALKGLLDAVDWIKPFDGTATAAMKPSADEIEAEVRSKRPTNEAQKKPNELQDRADDTSEGSPTGGAAADALAEAQQPGSLAVVSFTFAADIGARPNWDLRMDLTPLAAAMGIDEDEEGQPEMIAAPDHANGEAHKDANRLQQRVDDGGSANRNPFMLGDPSKLGNPSQLIFQPGEDHGERIARPDHANGEEQRNANRLQQRVDDGGHAASNNRNWSPSTALTLEEGGGGGPHSYNREASAVTETDSERCDADDLPEHLAEHFIPPDAVMDKTTRLPNMGDKCCFFPKVVLFFPIRI